MGQLPKTPKPEEHDLRVFFPSQIKEFYEKVPGGNDRVFAASAILSMGAPIDGSEKKKIKLALRSDLIESWGNSESLGTITESEDVDRRPDSIGRPFLTDSMVIVDDDGNPVPCGSLGRIAGSSEAGFTRYCGRPQSTAETLKNNLIISGDIGYVDSEGYFYVRGRVEESFVLNGERIFCRDIERAISSSMPVKECAATWLRQANGEVCVAIAVIPQRGSEDRIQSLVHSVVERTIAIPAERQRIILTQSLPKNPAGKIDRVALERIFAGTEGDTQ